MKLSSGLLFWVAAVAAAVLQIYILFGWGPWFARALSNVARPVLSPACCLYGAPRHNISLFSGERPFSLAPFHIAHSLPDASGASYYCVLLSEPTDLVSQSMSANHCVFEDGEGLNVFFTSLEKRAKQPPCRLNVADIGANLGSFSLFLAARGYNVFSFEVRMHACVPVPVDHRE